MYCESRPKRSRWCSTGVWRSASRAHSSRWPPASAPEPIEMRLDMAEQRVGQMHAQQIGQRRIGAVEIHARWCPARAIRLVGRDRFDCVWPACMIVSSVPPAHFAHLRLR